MGVKRGKFDMPAVHSREFEFEIEIVFEFRFAIQNICGFCIFGMDFGGEEKRSYKSMN